VSAPTQRPRPATDVAGLAARLDDAWQRRIPVRPLSETDGLDTPDVAYAVQRRWTELRQQRGERVVGAKIGLTSRPMQEQIGVSTPDFGSLWASRWYPARHGRVELPAEEFVQPRTEGEIAFLLGRPLAGAHVTAAHVLAATDALAVSVEVIDSRIENWQITLADTVADNASYGAFTLGPWSRQLRGQDLRTVGMVLSQRGRPVVEGTGSAALGHPARAVAWLVRTLAGFGVGLQAGEIVLSGSLGPSLPSRRGDSFVVEMYGQPPLAVTFG
jgi:2-keto-4-pentenoate hydratase